MKIYEYNKEITDYSDLGVVAQLKEAKMLQYEVSRYQYFVCPLVIHSKYNIRDCVVSVSQLSHSGETLNGSALCLNTSGVDSRGETLASDLSIDCDTLKIIYVGYDLSQAQLGRYSGMINIGAKAIPIFVNVTDKPVFNGGNAAPNELSRLQWLNSKLEIDNRLIERYEPIVLDKNEYTLTGKKAIISSDGLIANVVSYFDKSNNICAEPQTNLFYAPMALTVGGQKFKITKQKFTSLENIAGIYAEGKSESLKMEIGSFLRYQGCFDYSIKIKAEKDIIIDDIALTTYFATAKYNMGLGKEGGDFGDIDYKWTNPKCNTAYVGDINAGAFIKFKNNLSTNSIMPFLDDNLNCLPYNSWYNFGTGSIKIVKNAQGAALTAATGRVILPKGKTIELSFEVWLTPFRALNIAKSFAVRQLVTARPLTAQNLVDTCGVNCLNNIDINIDSIYSATIDTPICAKEGLKKLVSEAHTANIGIKAVTDTTMLTNYCNLNNIGKEVLKYTANSVKTVAESRADNYFMECLAYFMKATNCDGLSIKNSDISANLLMRIKKLCSEKKGLVGIVDVIYDKNSDISPFATSVAPLAFADKLALKGEYNMDKPVDYIMTEMSGLLFGNTANIVSGAFFGIKALLFGMLYAGDTDNLKRNLQATQLLSAIDDYEIASGKMYGFWDDRNPMTADKDDVYVTTYINGKQMFAVIYNDNAKKQEFELGINPRKGYTSKGKKMVKPEIIGIQKKRYLNFNKAFSLKGKSGMIVVIK